MNRISVSICLIFLLLLALFSFLSICSMFSCCFAIVARFYSYCTRRCIHNTQLCIVKCTVARAKCDNMWITPVIPSLHRKHFSVLSLQWGCLSLKNQKSAAFWVTCVAPTTSSTKSNIFKTYYITKQFHLYLPWYQCKWQTKETKKIAKWNSQTTTTTATRITKHQHVKFKRIFRMKTKSNKTSNKSETKANTITMKLVLSCRILEKEMGQIIIFGDGKLWWWHDTYRVKVVSSRFACSCSCSYTFSNIFSIR